MLNIIYKKLIHFISLFFDTCISVLKIIVQSKPKSKLPSPENPTCLILGNGPSLKESLNKYFDTIKKHELICVNNFAYSEYFEILKPQNYVMLDGYYFIFDNDKYNRSDVKDTFEKLKNVNWKMNIFIPAKAKKSFFYQNILIPNKNINVVFFNYVVIEGYKWFKYFTFKNGIGMPQCQNVLGAALVININRKYEHIYLLGADHSWHETLSVQSDNQIALAQHHFYDKAEALPEIVKDEVRQTKVTIASSFLSLYKTFKSYYVLADYAKYRKVKIYNASEKSYIDAFEKKQLINK